MVFYFLVTFSSALCARVFTVLLGFHLWSGTTGFQPIQQVFLRCKLCFLELVGVNLLYICLTLGFISGLCSLD